jgi:dihydrodipicolinate synthase/N-acetylneuraminate lyase
MSLTITREQRDAIYEAVMNHLSGIADVWMAVEQRDFANAKRLGALFAEDLRLLEDLGWSDRIDHEAVELTLPSDELTRTLTRLHADAAAAVGEYLSRPKEDEALAQRDHVASQALGELLSELAGWRDREEAAQ